jgi:hypothetical protein
MRNMGNLVNCGKVRTGVGQLFITEVLARAWIVPRVKSVFGFEWDTGFYINPVPLEQAAAFLQETEVNTSATPKQR